jgi:hypothetical protein
MEEDHNGHRTGMTGPSRSFPKIQSVPRKRTIAQVGDVGNALPSVQVLPNLGRTLDGDKGKKRKHARNHQAA